MSISTLVSCMACDHSIFSPTSTIPRTVLFLIFVLILSLNPTMANYKDNMSSRSEREGAMMKRNVKEFTTRKQYGIDGNSETLSIPKSASMEANNDVHFHPLSGQRRGSSGQPNHQSPRRRPALPWRESSVFNASAHEVPSGPNPISNR